jgi:SAM-dependent methyltransferase
MRALIPDGIEVRPGSAEALPLPDAAADAVTVAQAFHWFRADEALSEIHRVLRSAGALAIVRNRRDETDALQLAFAETLRRHRSHPPLEQELDVPAALTRSRRFAPAELREFPHVHRLDPAGFVALAASESSIARLTGAARAAALEDFARLLPDGSASVELRYVTSVHLTTRR